MNRRTPRDEEVVCAGDFKLVAGLPENGEILRLIAEVDDLLCGEITIDYITKSIKLQALAPASG
jgi:hypothetical protein